MTSTITDIPEKGPGLNFTDSIDTAELFTAESMNSVFPKNQIDSKPMTLDELDITIQTALNDNIYDPKTTFTHGPEILNKSTDTTSTFDSPVMIMPDLSKHLPETIKSSEKIQDGHDRGSNQFEPIRKGLRYIDQTEVHIDRAFEALVSSKPEEAGNNVKRAFRKLHRGIENLDFDNSPIDEDENGFDATKSGVDSFKHVSEELTVVLDALDNGNLRQALEALHEAHIELISGKFTTEYGVRFFDLLKGQDDTQMKDKPLYEPLANGNGEILPGKGDIKIPSPPISLKESNHRIIE